MKRKMSFFLACLIALMLYAGTASGEATPLLYKVSDDKGNSIYLLGTIHIGDKEMYPLSAPVQQAYREADILAVELDIVALTLDMEQMMEYSSAMMYSDGDSAKNHLSAETYQLALETLGLPAVTMNQMKPISWLTLLQEMSYQRIGYSSSYGVDQMLISQAYQDKKTVMPLETIELQMDALMSMSDGLVDYQLLQMIEYPAASDTSLKLLSTAWRQGNEEILRLLLSSEEQSVPKEFREEYAVYAKKLYTDRDAGFTKKAIEFLENGDKVLFAVGAAHIVADGGMVDRLRDAGYMVEEIGHQ
ncbi:MAG: TraB/GumN family protein [Clostridiales bacterium]|nr:TraB/GumN family protein [Clostridiales bacterium]